MVATVRGFQGKWAVIALSAAVLALPGARAEAASLYDILVNLAKNQKQIQAAEQDLKAAEERSKSAWAKWYQTLSVTGSYGHERQNNTTGTADTVGVPRELDLSLTQQLWDFG